MSLAIRGNDFNFFYNQQAKNRDRRSKMDSKIDTFCQIDIRDLAILGGRKSSFLDFFEVFLELFGKCLGIVFEQERPTFGCIFSFKG